MSPARALVMIVTLTGIALTGVASCGSDEATNPKGSGGTGGGLLEGGASGSAGSGRSGSGGGGSSSTVGTRLGQACVNDNECDPNGSTGLTCLPPDTTDLGGGGPPRGLCTTPCSTNDTCWNIDENSLCVEFSPGVAYCIEGCFMGPPLPTDPPKCHNRPQFACTPLDGQEIGETCSTTAQCPLGTVCFNGECIAVINGCLPACTGDQDCPAETFCDREMGVCRPESTEGDPLGTACDPTADEDSCSGFCQRVNDVPNLQGMCAEICSFLSPCAWEGDEPGGVCLFSTAINEDPDIGDLGFCAQMCDCSDDCRTPGFGCVPIDGLQAAFDRPGLCLYPFDEDGEMVETLEQCPGGGSGGTGGSGGSGGTAGNGGTAGSASGNGGEGGN